MSNQLTILAEAAITLLKDLIRTPSFSREEHGTATLIEKFFEERNISTTRIGNNVIARNRHFDPGKPTLLLNSHHDTVKPNAGYTRDPFMPRVETGKLYGLGSNDAGGALVSLLAAFLYFNEEKNLKFNIVFAGTAEEEISGAGGISSILEPLSPVNCAIIGEPTMMQMAVAERGLLVIDCIAKGAAGHAAREEGQNALYQAMDDIAWFREFRFPKISELLGANRMTVTVMETENKAHNIIPSTCNYVVDIRVNELYTFEEVLAVIRSHVKSEVLPRSTRLRSTSIASTHPLVLAGTAIGRKMYGSPTTSDKALVSFPALKMGPGDSARSHSADEYIYVKEIHEGIDLYIQVIKQLV